MAKIKLYRRSGKIDDVQTACGLGRHRSADCHTYSFKPDVGNLRVKHGIVSLRKIGKGQKAYIWEDKSGKVYDIVPKFD